MLVCFVALQVQLFITRNESLITFMTPLQGREISKGNRAAMYLINRSWQHCNVSNSRICF